MIQKGKGAKSLPYHRHIKHSEYLPLLLQQIHCHFLLPEVLPVTLYELKVLSQASYPPATILTVKLIIIVPKTMS